MKDDTALTRAGRGRRFPAPLAWIAAAAMLMGGAALIWFSTWRQPLLDADIAASAGDWTRALDRYAAAEARFNDWPVAQRVFPTAYRRTLNNQLAAHYKLGSFNAVLEKAETMPATAASHFWVGSSLFVLGKDEEKADERLGLFGRATEEFKAGLELEPQNWDAIYNYELTKRLFDELRKKPTTPPKQLLQLLRPQPAGSGKPVKRVG